MELSLSHTGMKFPNLSSKFTKEILQFLIVITAMQFLENADSMLTYSYRKLPQNMNFETTINTYPVKHVEDLTQCAMHCSYEPYCTFFKYTNKKCRMFHIWKDELSIANQVEGSSYYLVEDNEWHKMVFIQRNTSINLDIVFSSEGKQRHYLPAKCFESCPEFYRSDLINLWRSILPIDQAKVVLYKDGKEVINLRFNVNGSRLSTWYNRDRLLSSPWDDLNDISVTVRKFAVRRHYPNTFIISYKDWPTECSEQAGWIMVGYSRNCSWAPQNTIPFMIYSNKSSQTTWSDGYEEADAFGVFVSMV